MKRFLFPLAAACALLLPACQWNIGKLIRADSAVYVGGDVRKPVDGVVYCDESYNRYAWVPEVTYGTEPAVVEFVGMGPLPRKVVNLRPTERTILVRIGGAGIGAPEKLDALPEGARPFCLSKGEWPKPLYEERFLREQAVRNGQQVVVHGDRLPDWIDLYAEWDHRWLGDFEEEESTRGSSGAQLAAAPFDYVIDPALSVVTTPFYMIGFLFVAAVTGH